MSSHRYVGKPIPPDESLVHVEGRGRYVDDVRKDGMLYMGVLRSPYARARIRSIDFSDVKARAKLVLLPIDHKVVMRDIAIPAFFEYKGRATLVRMPVLPSNGYVNFEGQPVAAVVADSRYEAADLLELFSVDYEPLRPVMTIEESLSGGEVIHEGCSDNISVDVTLRGGDVERAFAEAAHVLEDELKVCRTIPNPMETRGVVAEWKDGKLSVWVTNQGTFRIKDQLVNALGLQPGSVTVNVVDVGGAFGTKSSLYPEYVLASYASLILKRPVKWFETRWEHMRSTTHGRDVQARISLAVNKEGKVLGMKGTVIADIGAFNVFINANYAPFIGAQLTGPYAIRAGEVRAISVFTNKTPLGPYRGAGRPEAAFFYESMMNLVAKELGLDPIEVRLRNLLEPSEMPFQTPLGLTVDREDYREILRTALNRFDYKRLREEVRRERARGKLIGIGLANYIELNRVFAGEGAKLTLRRDGRIYLSYGSGSHGQYHATIYRQLIADAIGVGFEDVVFEMSSSDDLPGGVGTFGSRSAVIGGEAVMRSALRLRDEVLERASRLFGIPRERLAISGRCVVDLKNGGELMGLGDVASEGEISVYEFVKGQDIFSYGIHMAVVEIDEETRTLRHVKYYAMDDAGRIINPLIAEGQIIGGIVMGISQVFYERAEYDHNGSLKIGGILEAGVAAAADIPMEIESHLYEYPSHYLHGARGIGEAGPIGAIPSLVNALEDALDTRIRSTVLAPDSLWDKAPRVR
ncbi:MAG: xanthine dehydrogenase family protein molybdopterin-binding subunit [Aigarchaeota archaeon]|nr:xanthine dehydrogenase family protein molybdopterin-binding subunit [Aigarchaeota archaeon]MDW8092236.1 xanthine dehydrogenase family protein molybdopterin-binding subunit [Nitrososphaerota archaeon]